MTAFLKKEYKGGREEERNEKSGRGREQMKGERRRD